VAPQHVNGNEKGQAQIFLDRFCQAFGPSGSLAPGGSADNADWAALS
jgi:hypothetical protein